MGRIPGEFFRQDVSLYHRTRSLPTGLTGLREEIVSPGVDVFVLGYWSEARGALVGSVEGGQDAALRVYSGRAEQVATMLLHSSKTTNVLGVFLFAGGMLLLTWLLLP